MVDIEYTWNGTRWHRTTVSVADYAAIMNSGMIDGKQIAAVRLWSHEYEEEAILETSPPIDVKVWLVYDFNLASQGSPAWKHQND